MAVIVPTTWSAGEAASADMNTYVRDVTRQLQGHSDNPKPFAIVTGANVSLSTGVFTTISFDTVVVNRVGLWDGATFTVPTGWAGWYDITANVDLDAFAGNKELRIAINGDEEGIAWQNIYGVGTPAFARMSASGAAWLDAGDTIDTIVFQDFPSDIDALRARMTAIWSATAN